MNPSKDVLKDILSIPSCSGHEGMLRDYILAFANGRGIASTVDRRGNVYLSKGTLAPGELYPCLVNHLDTVHSDQAAMAGIVYERWQRSRRAKDRLDLSEAPQAYKDIESVIDAERDLVEPLVRLVPLASLKGSAP